MLQQKTNTLSSLSIFCDSSTEEHRLKMACLVLMLAFATGASNLTSSSDAAASANALPSALRQVTVIIVPVALPGSTAVGAVPNVKAPWQQQKQQQRQQQQQAERFT
jgi:hypothetical protein